MMAFVACFGGGVATGNPPPQVATQLQNHVDMHTPEPRQVTCDALHAHATKPQWLLTFCSTA